MLLPEPLSPIYMLIPLSLMPPFSFQGRDCMVGLLQAYVDGKTTMSIHERKASIKEFYGGWILLKYILFCRV